MLCQCCGQVHDADGMVKGCRLCLRYRRPPIVSRVTVQLSVTAVSLRAAVGVEICCCFMVSGTLAM